MAQSPRKTPLNSKRKPSPSNQHRKANNRATARPSARTNAGHGAKTSSRPSAKANSKPGAKAKRATNPLPQNPGSFMGEEHSFGFDDAGLHIPTGNSEILLSRRQLLYGAAGLAALGAVGAGAKAYSDHQSEQNAIHTLDVSEESVASLDSCELVDEDQLVAKSAEIDMPYGTLIWANTDSVAACLVPTKKSKPIARIGILNITAGTYDIVVDHAVQQDEGYEIYDVRMSENGIIWTESNILQGSWSLWAAPVVGTSVGEPAKVEEGDANWELPSLAAVGAHAFWQLRPSLSGDATTEESQVKTALFTKLSSSKSIYTSNGRFATHLYPTDEGIVITPRHPESSSYYQLVHLNESDGETTDSITLPSLMTPLEAGYGPYGFTFSFKSIYNYGGGIANLGTYTPTSKHGSSEYDNLNWFHFGRTPSVAPCWCGSCFIVKSTTAVAAVDVANNRYATLELENDMESYGDVLCSFGERQVFVTSTNVNDTTTAVASGHPDEATKKCIVRCWQVTS